MQKALQDAQARQDKSLSMGISVGWVLCKLKYEAQDKLDREQGEHEDERWMFKKFHQVNSRIDKDRIRHLDPELKIKENRRFVPLVSLREMTAKMQQGIIKRQDPDDALESEAWKRFGKLHQKDVGNLNFPALVPLVAIGGRAYGWKKPCPRSWQKKASSPFIEYAYPHCSIADAKYEDGAGAEATHFLSWVWNYSLDEVLSALRVWHNDNPGKKYLWWCFFNNNQHKILQDEVPQTPQELEDVFGFQLVKVAQQGGSMLNLMTLTGEGKPEYTTRIWCMYEVGKAAEKDIAMSAIFPAEAYDKMQNMTLKEISACFQVNVETAEATETADKDRILEQMRTCEGGVEAVNAKTEIALSQQVGQVVLRILQHGTLEMGAAVQREYKEALLAERRFAQEFIEETLDMGLVVDVPQWSGLEIPNFFWKWKTSTVESIVTAAAKEEVD